MPPTSISEASMQKSVCPGVHKASWVASTLEFSGEITSQRGVSPEGKRVDFKPDYRVTQKKQSFLSAPALAHCPLAASKATNSAGVFWFLGTSPKELFLTVLPLDSLHKTRENTDLPCRSETQNSEALLGFLRILPCSL